jgi:diaminohydroxyphosphoribosylaminopyrimidine deaminase/5-amino-6-(5-phosphoribosylamino)uracil reductase
MKRAIELAKRGIGSVNPNPLVGAVIVKDGEVIAEGWHQKYGGPHAEVNAFSNAKCDVAGADMYVTLEPCAHYGKTPPCAEAIVKKGIKRVFVGMKDPNPLVAGKGIKILENAGIEVVCGVCEEECRELNPVFLKYITTGRPFVVMKTAMSLDGKIADYEGKSQWISSEGSREAVQYMRKALSGIMVGINTVLADNPRLTCRIENSRNPVKIVVDSKLRISEDARLFEDLPDTRCIIAVASEYDREKAERLKARGVEIIETKAEDGKVDLNGLMVELGRLKLDSILLEGGGTLNFSALESGVVDMVVSFIAPMLIGGGCAKTPIEGKGFLLAEAVKLEDVQIKEYHGDCLVYGKVRRN